MKFIRRVELLVVPTQKGASTFTLILGVTGSGSLTRGKLGKHYDE
ncbi:MAG: hypothetical protein U5K72_12105 [Balneolaceae bacterium]|nr:hypothetical protein [Balneolaceae bacterium]